MGDSGKEDDDSDRSIIREVGEFFYGNDAFADKFQDFVAEKCSIIDLDEIEKGVFKVEYTHIYEEYQGMLESELEDFVSDTSTFASRHFGLSLPDAVRAARSSHSFTFSNPFKLLFLFFFCCFPSTPRLSVPAPPTHLCHARDR